MMSGPQEPSGGFSILSLLQGASLWFNTLLPRNPIDSEVANEHSLAMVI